jgi:hypothetical protein
MKTLNFKVTLLSDVIINQRAATEGNQKTLDFIPGNVFLGVAAGIYNDLPVNETFTLFHSGKVRFGDAHPFVNKKRAVKVPASWYKKKDDKGDSELFVHHGMPKEGLKDEMGNPVQVKQYREDFIVNGGQDKVSKVDIKKHFAIKSAYDSDKRRSEDAKMYGYESLQAGSEWCFEVVFNDDIAAEMITKLENSLVGTKRVGRSSTAQYGLVKIEKVLPFDNGFHTWPQPKTRDKDEKVVFVYAESRLIFFDQYGLPTFTPTAAQLGFPDAEICWEMSQIRTFQYAPYNNQRKTRDADRMGIEKGSVFCITGTTSNEKEKWVGSYQNEGFGKVLVNPDFLEYTGINGEAKFSFTKDKAISKIPGFAQHPIQTNDKPVLEYLKKQKQTKENQKFIYEKVNAFVNDNANKFKGDNFASQWGTIRSLAMQFRNPTILKERVYSNQDSYLKHGVAAEKWGERGRTKLLENFVKEFDKKQNLLSEGIINLAAEMAKKCRRD